MRRLLVVALMSTLCVGTAHAVEGMWQPAQLPAIASQLKAAGLKLNPNSLTDLTAYPMGAIVSLGGCTASFVSDQGLIVTNHHCGYGDLQYNSTPENNLIVNGFLAKTMAEELPGSPGSRVFVTEKISDVTDKIQAKLHPWLTGAERYKAIDNESKQLVETCESEAGYHCRVASFYGGLSYQLIKQLEIRDVRLVYAPPESIGKFGGDVDNWMWPRHTGDFSYLRAYVAPDGKSATYSKDNVPYRPAHVLKVNPEGLEAGDFVMVVGYPGRTNRYRLASEVKHAVDWTYPHEIKVYEDSLNIINKAAEADPAVGVKYASRVAGLNNYLKNFQGQMEGLQRADAIKVKQGEQAQLQTWLQEQGGDDNKAMLEDIGKLQQGIAEEQKNSDRDMALSLVTRTSELSSAIRLVHLAKERPKADLERDDGYQQRDWIRIEEGLKSMQRRFDPGVDQQFLVYGLLRYVALPEEQHLPSLDTWLDGAKDEKSVTAKVAKLYAGSKMADAEDRLKWFKADTKTIDASNDTMLVLARDLQPELDVIRKQEEAREGDMSKLRPQYMQAIINWKKSQNQPVYPDANSTLRVTYGTVQGVSPRDAVTYAPFTTVQGILQKDTGTEPFNAPQAELEAIRAGGNFDGYASTKQGALPVNFLADLDITGGNSGSPAMDANGKLVGLAFDGNWESVSGDWLFNQQTNRSIEVDVRYMLWVMHHLDHADNLLREMGLQVPN